MKKNKFLFSLCGVTFLRLRKKGTERKDLSFFHTTKKARSLETRQQGKSSGQKERGKTVHPNVTASVLHILTF